MRTIHSRSCQTALLSISMLISLTSAAPSQTPAVDAADISPVTEPRPYCVSGDGCFPSQAEWDSFGHSLAGELIQPEQPALPCYDGPNFSPETCAFNVENWQNPYFIANTPGALMYTQWLGDGSLETCPIPMQPNTNDEACGKGREAAYAVLVENEQDIQKAVNFAAKHHLRLRVRNTGHDYVGRSSAAGSFTVNTRFFNTNKLVEQWRPNCSHHAWPGRWYEEDDPPRKAVVVGPAAIVQEIYESAQYYNVTLVGGVSRTVGASGGWVLGGGHGPLGTRLGMGVDNVLQFTVIDAQGRRVIANECQNRDLFWALRGGGAAFGVVTEVVFKAYEKLKGVVGIFGTVTVGDEALYAQFIERWISTHRNFGGANISVYNYLSYPESVFAVLLPVLGKDRQTLSQARATAENAIADFVKWANETEGVTLTLKYVTEEDWLEFYNGPFAQGLAGLDTVGLNLLVSSRLVARSVLLDDGELARLVDTFAAIKTPLIGHFVTSGVISKTDPDSTALNPAFRDSAFIIEPLVTWPSNATQAEVSALQAYLTNTTNAIGEVSGHAEQAGYYNEANPQEANWQSVFWSKAHYSRLLRIKQKWDSDGVFSCNKCVGSEIYGS